LGGAARGISGAPRVSHLGERIGRALERRGAGDEIAHRLIVGAAPGISETHHLRRPEHVMCESNGPRDPGCEPDVFNFEQRGSSAIGRINKSLTGAHAI